MKGQISRWIRSDPRDDCGRRGRALRSGTAAWPTPASLAVDARGSDCRDGSSFGRDCVAGSLSKPQCRTRRL